MIAIILTIALAGFIVWIITQIPMNPIFRNLILGVVVIFMIIWLLQTLGLHTGFPVLHLGK